MGTIIAMAKTLRVKYNEFPLEKFHFDILWTFGDYFPVVPFGGSNTIHPNCSNKIGLLYISKRPCGMQLWVATSPVIVDDIDEFEDEEELTLVCDLRITKNAFLRRNGSRAVFLNDAGYRECADMSVAQEVIFALGWGPCPYYRRPGKIKMFLKQELLYLLEYHLQTWWTLNIDQVISLIFLSCFLTENLQHRCCRFGLP